jgi:hypothetical protein
VISTPILCIDEADCIAFTSVAAAESYLEPDAVADEHLLLFGADGSDWS